MKRRTFVWITIPLLVLGFSFMALRTGYMTRGSNNVTAHFQELHVYPDAAYLPYQTTMLVFTAQRTRYELSVPDRSAFFYENVPMPTDGYNFAQRAGGGIRGITRGSVDNSTEPLAEVSQGQWQSETYYYSGYHSMQAQADSDLSIVIKPGDKPALQGTFNLDLPFDLHRAYLVVPGYKDGEVSRETIGSIGGQGTYDIKSLASNMNDVLSEEQNYLTRSIGVFNDYQVTGSRLGLSYLDEALLVGFTEDVPVIADFKRPHTGHELSMVVIHLPLERIVSEQGPATVLGTKVIGGAGFELDRFNYGSYNSGYSPQSSERYYRFELDSYIDIAFEVAGDYRTEGMLDVRVNVFENDYNQTLTTPQNHLKADFWNGSEWQETNFVNSTSLISIPSGQASRSNDIVYLRLTALDLCYLRLPDATF